MTKSKLNNIYQKYNLPASEFDHQRFDIEWGRSLVSSGMGAICNSITEEAKDRLYLQAPLSQEDYVRINSMESINAAKMAQPFQEKVGKVSIVDNKERLVDLRDFNTAEGTRWDFTEATYHPACGDYAGQPKLFLVREEVARRLVELSDKLYQIGLTIFFQDGFRPTGVQEGLFQRRIDMARRDNPSWPEDDILLEAQSKTAYTPRFAAHKAGAAVDIQLKQISTNSFVDIGHNYPDGGEIVRLDTPFVTQEQWTNRKILQHLASSIGLLMYPYEDWHLCYGDATAAVITNPEGPNEAQYGPVKSYDEITGAIIETYPEDELDARFAF